VRRRMKQEEKLLCGVDLGGTKLAVGLVSRDGTIVDRIVVHDHLNKTEREICRQIASLAKTLLVRNDCSEEDLIGIGVGFTGHIRFREGIVITTSNFRNFKIRDFPLRKTIQDQFETYLPVIVDNDANAQAYAEYLYGAGRDFDTEIFLTISTGIGAGMVLEGNIYRGMTGTAGEIGHTIIKSDSDIECGCGNFGCLMSHACGLSIPYIVKKKVDQGKETYLPIDADTPPEDIDGELICEGLNRNDPLATEVVMECADYIGIGIYNLFQIFNPPIIVLGGGLLNWGQQYLERIKAKFYSLVREMMYDEMKIALSELGDNSGLIGAAALILEQESRNNEPKAKRNIKTTIS
jgi:glucokinase